MSAPRSLKRVHPANRRSAIDKEARFTLPILSNDDNGITRVRIINRERWYSLNQSSLSIISPTTDVHFRLSVYLILCLFSASFDFSPIPRNFSLLSFLVCVLPWMEITVEFSYGQQTVRVRKFMARRKLLCVSSARVMVALLTFRGTHRYFSIAALNSFPFFPLATELT